MTTNQALSFVQCDSTAIGTFPTPPLFLPEFSTALLNSDVAPYRTFVRTGVNCARSAVAPGGSAVFSETEALTALNRPLIVRTELQLNAWRANNP